MLNSVGLQGPGVEAWLERRAAGAARPPEPAWWRRSGAARRRSSHGPPTLLAGARPEVVAVEVNVSCPNLEARNQLFAHSPDATAEVVAATAAAGRPRWAKLSPNTDRLVEVAGAAAAAGAEAVTLVNTVMGMVIDVERRRPVLGAGGGGLSGPAMHPVAVRAVHDVHRALPDLPIVGVGGVVDAPTAVELLLAGASAVQVGTATFADPRAPAAGAGGAGAPGATPRRGGAVRADRRRRRARPRGPRRRPAVPTPRGDGDADDTGPSTPIPGSASPTATAWPWRSTSTTWWRPSTS